jgi:hypothetical protein
MAVDIPQLETGAGRGSTRKQMQLGDDYFLGHGVQRSEQSAAYWYEKAANAGDPQAQLQIGFFYQVGIGVARDPSRAAHWYQLASAGGSATAKMNLGVAYLWGTGVPENKPLALQLFHEAVDKGCGMAAAYLGDAYALGFAVPKDLSTAEHWFAVGAKMHDPRSQFRLAALVSSGTGSSQDLHKAAALLRDSGGKGYVPAKHALGLLLVNHPELATVPNEGLHALQESADAGTWESSAALGALARDGHGMTADPKAAYRYFRIAQTEGGEEGRALVDVDVSLLKAKLSSGDVQALDQEAATWVQKHPAVLEFVYKGAAPTFALTAPNQQIHAGRLVPIPTDN